MLFDLIIQLITSFLIGGCFIASLSLLAERSSENVSGIIISNSCDINIHNKIPKNRKIIFAPLIKLADYYSFLKSTKKTDEIITNTIDTIKSQRVTDIFYFPEIKGKINESIALLDDLHSMPISEFTPAEKTQLFRLSQSGFYLFLIKLSIHLTRMFEGVARSN